MTRFHCTAAADHRSEPLFATASRVDRWVGVEQTGPWGPETVPASRLDADLTAALHRHATAAGARLLLIRRPGGKGLSRHRHVIVADSRPGHEQALTASFDDLADLLATPLPFDGETAGADWAPAPDPLLFVCTHGRHDPCCAVRGRPVAKALAAVHPDGTWECSHVGGDRFAANVVVLPRGLYLGRVPAESAAEIVDAVRAGRLPAAEFRG